MAWYWLTWLATALVPFLPFCHAHTSHALATPVVPGSLSAVFKLVRSSSLRGVMRHTVTIDIMISLTLSTAHNGVAVSIETTIPFFGEAMHVYYRYLYDRIMKAYR